VQPITIDFGSWFSSVGPVPRFVLHEIEKVGPEHPLMIRHQMHHEFAVIVRHATPCRKRISSAESSDKGLTAP
jgi:hypothetical protein